MIFCSAIIPTVGRQTLSRAVESVLNQNYHPDKLEVIVVNDSGEPLRGNFSWRDSKVVKVINTHRRERSFARNSGAAVARGKYLHFLDDDDWLTPDAFQHFSTLSLKTEAKWLYGISQLVDKENTPLIRLRHELNGNCFTQVMAGEWIPLQASIIEAQSFFSVGGFNQLISGPEDIDLLRKIALVGDLAETPNTVVNIVRSEGNSTTDYMNHPEASRWAREIILQDQRVFRRLRGSATSDYWRGRIFRLYLTSSLWNFRRRQISVAAERGFVGIKALILDFTSIFTLDYWRAVTKPYDSFTFQRGWSETR